MKRFIVKMFLLVAGIVAIAEGALLFVVGFRAITLRKFASFYQYILFSKQASDITIGVGVLFLLIGVLLLVLSIRLRKPMKAVIIRQGGEFLKIPVSSIQDFVEQVLNHSSNITGFNVKIQKKGNSLCIDIISNLTDGMPVGTQVSNTRNILKSRIKEVFELNHVMINFEMRRINHSKSEEYKESEAFAQSEERELAEDAQDPSSAEEREPGLKEKHKIVSPW